ncbi:MAG: PTS glucose transporter subunit IIA [Elusimicrobiota bacterium]|jgi:PTS system glucose-specific IIA component|nr:PTS glucose transporter subunit IIA [Elusimicrobiota bacterium]
MNSDMNLIVFSPVCGTVMPLSEVPDPVFADKMLGDGLAINPQEGFIYAPFNGAIKAVHKFFHALVIETKGVEVLIHIGVETANMKGDGFKAFVTIGQEVKQGDKLISFDPKSVAKKAKSNLVIVIVSNLPQADLNKTERTGVKAGDFLFSIGKDLS